MKPEFMCPTVSCNSPDAREQFMAALFPWIAEFCVEHGFFDQKGRPHVSRAMNLAIGNTVRGRKERAFLEALCIELERRYPGAAYPVTCVRLARKRPTLGLVS